VYLCCVVMWRGCVEGIEGFGDGGKEGIGTILTILQIREVL
jgi:hypothetical protein